MLKRTIIGFVLLPLLLILLLAPLWALALCLAVIAGFAVYELLRHWPQPIKARILMMGCGFVVVIYALIYTHAELYNYLTACFLFLFVLFVEVLIDPDHFGFFGLVGVFFAAVAFPMMYGSVLRLAFSPERLYIVIIPFLITMSNDVFAYFVGSLLGKHKLAPSISPNKTVEGAIGGYLCCVAVLLGYGALVQAAGCTVSYGWLAVYALVGGVVSQMGDLSMSAAKRNLGIKDFGKIIPGHGGMLDRFDSLLFVAPVMEMLMTVAPAIHR